MFGFGKKHLASSGLWKGMTDCHSHILPGVDDGVATLQKAVEVLKYYESAGIEHVILTPHIMEDYPDNTAASLHREFEKLKGVYDGPVGLSLGAEYMIDADFEKHLNQGDLMPLFGGYILIETSCTYQPLFFEDRIKEIQSRGYPIMLAHPERYRYLNMPHYEQFKEQRVGFQLNIFSLTGFYGKDAMKKAKKLLHGGFYNCIGTDLHDLDSFARSMNHMTLSVKEYRIVDELKHFSP